MRSVWHWSLGALVVLHFFLIMVFLSEMHNEMPLNKWRHDGDSVNFGLVLFWYLAPVPSLLVTALAFNSSRLAATQGAEFAQLGRLSWVVLWLTCVAAVIHALYTRVLIDSDSLESDELQIAMRRGWVVSQLYTILSVVILILDTRLLHRRWVQIVASKQRDGARDDSATAFV